MCVVNSIIIKLLEHGKTPVGNISSGWSDRGKDGERVFCCECWSQPDDWGRQFCQDK